MDEQTHRRSTTDPDGFAASSASSNKDNQQEKQHNSSFRAIRQESNQTRKNRKENQRSSGGGCMVQDQPRDLTWESWMSRERRRGYETSPNTSKFNDLNDLDTTRNIYQEKEVLRIKKSWRGILRG